MEFSFPVCMLAASFLVVVTKEFRGTNDFWGMNHL